MDFQKQIDRIQTEFTELKTRDAQLVEAQTQVAAERDFIGKRILNLQGQMAMIDMLKAEEATTGSADTAETKLSLSVVPTPATGAEEDTSVAEGV